jgi:hypothetical protein
LRTPSSHSSKGLCTTPSPHARLQSGPENGGSHLQAKLPSPAAGVVSASAQAPPFRHGLSSYSAHSKTSSHASPPKPCGQAHENERSPSAQAAPF